MALLIQINDHLLTSSIQVVKYMYSHRHSDISFCFIFLNKWGTLNDFKLKLFLTVAEFSSLFTKSKRLMQFWQPRSYYFQISQYW